MAIAYPCTIDVHHACDGAAPRSLDGRCQCPCHLSSPRHNVEQPTEQAESAVDDKARCAICDNPVTSGYVCVDCDRDLREQAELDAKTDKSDWPL